MQQIYPKTYKTALDAYKDSASSQRGYLLIDLRCETHENIHCLQGFFQTTRIMFITEVLAKKTDPAAAASKSFYIFAKVYSRTVLFKLFSSRPLCIATFFRGLLGLK